MPEDIEPNQPSAAEGPKFKGNIRRAQIEDLEALQPILEQWIRDPDAQRPISEEISSVLDRVRGSAEGKTTNTYFVAETIEGKLAGMIGLQPMDAAMAYLVSTENPIEMTNFYVDQAARNSGVGTALFDTAAEQAQQAGFSEIIWNSGPRYKDSAWGYYTHKFGDSIGELKDFYGPGFSAPVWHHVLNTN